MSTHGVETHIIAQDLESQKCAFCRQSEVDAVWNFNGPILEHYQDHGQTVNNARLKPAIRCKRRGMLTNGVDLHHDNALPHTAAAIVETI